MSFIVEFGSHVKDPEKEYDPVNGPRDIDIIYYGMDKKVVLDIVLGHYPSWKGPIDFIEMRKPKVPIPYAAEQRAKILFSDNPKFKIIFRPVTGEIASVFREGKGVDVALKRLETESFPIRLEERNMKYLTYGRKVTQRAAFYHFGEKNLEELYDKLWWGRFLKLYLSARMFSAVGMSKFSAMFLQIDNKKKNFYFYTGGKRRQVFQLDALIDLLDGSKYSLFFEEPIWSS